MAYKNPYARQLVYRERKYFAQTESDMAGAYAEAERAEEKPVLVCGKCNGRAYFKPTIGAHKCTRCGALRSRGEWIGGS